MGLKTFTKFLLLLLALGIGGIYIFISSTLRVSRHIKITAPAEKLYFLMSNKDNWKLWQNRGSVKPIFTYTLIKVSYPNIFLEASTFNKKIPIEIKIQDMGKPGTTTLFWRSEINAGISPWSRILCYLEARDLKNEFSEVLREFADYTKINRNIYGINIVESLVKDTIIATISRYVPGPPSEAMICKLTNDLRQQINNAGLAITDSSMRVVQHVQKASYKIMLGYPINKIPELNSNLVIKKMIPGKLLSSTVYGGPASINEVRDKMQQYILDHGKEEVALPYEITITNRCKETDTTKWITKLCYPVF